MSKWGKLKIVGRVALGVVGVIVPAVAKVEQLAEELPHLKGKAKQDKAIELIKAAIEASEDVSGKDLLNDPAADAATRAIVDAVVNLQNVLAKHPAMQPRPASASDLGVHAGSTGE